MLDKPPRHRVGFLRFGRRLRYREYAEETALSDVVIFQQRASALFPLSFLTLGRNLGMAS